jgi:hypothetical protein
MLLPLLALMASNLVEPSAASTIEPAFTATIVSTYPDGRVSKLWLERDGSFTAIGRRQDKSGGRWALKGDKICLSQLKPFPIPFASYCAPLPHGDWSQGWDGKAVTGEPIRIRIVPGR